MKNIVCCLTVCATLLACGGAAATRDQTPSPGSAIVLHGSELAGSLLDAMRSRVPGMTVTARAGQCPVIMLRGPRSISNQGNPSVYIDGTLMVDTCVLENLHTAEVDRVEIYQSGILSQPNIQRNPFGVIIVYRINR